MHNSLISIDTKMFLVNSSAEAQSSFVTFPICHSFTPSSRTHSSNLKQDPDSGPSTLRLPPGIHQTHLFVTVSSPILQTYPDIRYISYFCPCMTCGFANLWFAIIRHQRLSHSLSHVLIVTCAFRRPLCLIVSVVFFANKVMYSS